MARQALFRCDRDRAVEATWLELVARRRARPRAELVGSERPMGIGVAAVRGT